MTAKAIPAPVTQLHMAATLTVQNTPKQSRVTLKRVESERKDPFSLDT